MIPSPGPTSVKGPATPSLENLSRVVRQAGMVAGVRISSLPFNPRFRISSIKLPGYAGYLFFADAISTTMPSSSSSLPRLFTHNLQPGKDRKDACTADECSNCERADRSTWNCIQTSRGATAKRKDSVEASRKKKKHQTSRRKDEPRLLLGNCCLDARGDRNGHSTQGGAQWYVCLTRGGAARL